VFVHSEYIRFYYILLYSNYIIYTIANRIPVRLFIAKDTSDHEVPVELFGAFFGLSATQYRSIVTLGTVTDPRPGDVGNGSPFWPGE